MENYHVCCPNCGSRSAQRRYFTRTDAQQCQGSLVNQVECPSCDYLMVTCAVDGRVLEAYTSGLSAPRAIAEPKSRNIVFQL